MRGSGFLRKTRSAAEIRTPKKLGKLTFVR